MTDWDDRLAAWWTREARSDPYINEVRPLALRLLAPRPGDRVLDLGCGEGWLLRALTDAGARAVGVDLSMPLLREATRHGPVVRLALPGLSCFPDASFDAAVAVLVLDHIDDATGLFREAARVTRPGGALVLVGNHPVFTAPGSAPVVDPEDGELLWRWGDYLRDGGVTIEPAGGGEVAFHHHPLGVLLGGAAEAGWCLIALEEAGVGEERARADPLLGAQAGIPRILACRWRRAARVDD